MYLKVIFGEAPWSDKTVFDGEVPSEVLVNPECPIRVIYDFLRKTFQVPHYYELDLCDESGNLIFMQEKEHWAYGLNYLVPKSTYFVVLFEKDEETGVINPLLCLPESTKKHPGQWNDFVGKLKKQLNPSMTKPGRTVRTRSNTSRSRW